MLYKIYSKFCHKAKPHFTTQSHFLIQYHNSVHTGQIQYQLFGVHDPLSVCTYVYIYMCIYDESLPNVLLSIVNMHSYEIKQTM